ncbi:hypothetical protein H5410_049118 [Solanum commersonii]|uniref:Cytochrome P450 n=1 Tax=Solanum commersonii TaxID=4109 RepID=A0A9J5XMX5_SOLCO|nr:hypothetical protein H5410_049118 [Solanum commersonii]
MYYTPTHDTPILLDSSTIVIISSSTIAKQVLKIQDQAFSTYRFIPNAIQAHNYCKFSVAFLPVCPQWRTLKLILNKNIFSSNSLDANQHLRSQKVKELIDYCTKCSQQGKAVDIGQVAFKTSLIFLSNTLFSKDLADPFSDSKVELKEVVLKNIIDEMGNPNLVDFFPILEKIDLQGTRHRTTIHIGKLFKLFDGLINEQLEEKRRFQSEKSDVLNVFLDICEENPEDINHNYIKSVFLDLLVVGTDTTTKTLEWIMAEILKQPEIMKKVQTELEEIIGKGKSIEEVDVSRLPYLQCIIKETLRLHPFAPFLVPCKVEQDVELCGYIVPKGSQVLVNVWEICRDSTFWEDPLVFKPEVKELIAYCEKYSQQGEALDVGHVAFKTNLSLLSNTFFSKDFADPFSDSKVELKDVIWGVMSEVGKPNLVDFFPILEKNDFQGIRCCTTIYFGKLFELFDELINERLEEKRMFCNERSDVLEAFLNFSEENPQEINHNHIKSMFLDLFGVGTDTTTSTFEWAMTEIFKQPEVMKKIQVELAEIIGKGKPIEEADISRLPYLQCIIKETLRMHSPVPFLVPRKVEQDVQLCDYIIPKGSQLQVLVNVWAIGRDCTFWKDPLVFKPERFLSSNLNMRGQDFELISFGAGQRICPGLPLALRMVPVMLGSLLNSFNWKLEAQTLSQKN